MDNLCTIYVDIECYVLRLGGNGTRYLGIDRKTEHECGYPASQASYGQKQFERFETSTNSSDDTDLLGAA